MTHLKTIWLIEDDEDQADQFGRILEQASNDQIEVKYVAVRPQITDYTPLLTDMNTGAIIIDQRLSDLSGVAYQGIEVADFLRTSRPEIPIFMLTQHSTDDLLVEKEGSVEFVIGKSELIKRDSVYAARILRSIGRYEASLDEKQARLKELIDLKLSDGLSEDEANELQDIRADYERPFEHQLTQQEQSWEKEQSAREEFLQQLKSMTNDLRETAGG